MWQALARNLSDKFQSTLLMRGATSSRRSPRPYRCISIHAPHARSDCQEIDTRATPIKFQSTLLMRGATKSASSMRLELLYFNPRSSCEERLSAGSKFLCILFNFNPRSSCEERRTNTLASTLATVYFNPRSSCEERLVRTPVAIRAFKFQSTLLMRGATDYQIAHQSAPHDFNPRSSCEERLSRIITSLSSAYFNPRSSCEERPKTSKSLTTAGISIHAPHARSDDIDYPGGLYGPQFQSTLLMRGATL